MKAIFFMFLLCCICCLSCSDEQNTLSEEQNVIENKTFEKVSSLELKQQLLDYLNNSVKTRTTFNNAEMNYDLGMQEILRPQIQTFGEEMIVVRSKMDANNIMAFYKENGVIENCLIIECAQNAEDALEDVNIKKITFGLSMENDYYATNMQRHGVTQSYDLMYQGEFLTKINLSVPGIHNVYNSLAAITVADYLGVPIKDIAENIAKFTGVHRRFELLGKPNGITVVDDFAHHPTELTSTLETAMELGFNHVWAVFQPHTFSRTALLMDDFAKALKIPDTAIISAILPVRETNTYNVYNTDLGKKVPGSVCLETFDEITDYIVKNAKEGDLVLTMGGGNVYMCANQIVKALENK